MEFLCSFGACILSLPNLCGPIVTNLEFSWLENSCFYVLNVILVSGLHVALGYPIVEKKSIAQQPTVSSSGVAQFHTYRPQRLRSWRNVQRHLAILPIAAGYLSTIGVHLHRKFHSAHVLYHIVTAEQNLAFQVEQEHRPQPRINKFQNNSEQSKMTPFNYAKSGRAQFI